MDQDPISNFENTWDWCQSLLDKNVYEGLNIDFKKQIYDLSDTDEVSTFLKHISAFANSSGGYLVFGVDEKGGRIKEIVEIEISESLLRQYSNFLDKNIHPKSPFDIHPISNPDNPTTGVMVIHIPESMNKPVAGNSNGQLIYARRVGESSLKMTEAELSSMYKLRFEGDWQASLKLKELEVNQLNKLDFDKHWLVISGRPTYSGNFPLSKSNFELISKKYLNRTLGDGLLIHTISSISVGYRCFVLKDRTLIGEPASYFMAHLYEDGSFTIALALDSSIKNENIDFHDRMPMADVSISEQCLTESLLTAFELIVSHTQICQTTGTLDLQASINGNRSQSLAVLKPSAGGSIFGFSYPSEIVNPALLRSHQTSLQISDLLKTIEGRYLPAKSLLDGLLSNFGIVESSFFDELANINLGAWPKESQNRVRQYVESINLA